jgi:DNA-directed RNA polymerase II subunit RPB1
MGSQENRISKYNELINAISHFIDNTDGQFHQGQRREFLSIKQRMQGKDGIIRQNSMGKRANFSARTVISPDPSLKFTQIRIPEVMAPFLTRPVKITEFNRERLTELLRMGQVSVLTQIAGPKAGQLQRVNDWLKSKYVPQIGDTLERWLQNGDYILANRQPTLHKQSMVGYEVVLGKPLSIGLHLSVTSQHNADFDLGMAYSVFSSGKAR